MIFRQSQKRSNAKHESQRTEEVTALMTTDGGGMVGWEGNKGENSKEMGKKAKRWEKKAKKLGKKSEEMGEESECWGKEMRIRGRKVQKKGKSRRN